MTNAAIDNKEERGARCQQSWQFPPRLSAISYLLATIGDKNLHPDSSCL